ncbi:MAG: DUF4402 domain-containing protein [Myxococcota bacterium]
MVRLRYFALGLLLAAGFSPSAAAVDFAHDGHVDVYAALGTAETQDLLFGIVTDADGTVTLDTADTITADPDGIHVGGTVASGDYALSGEPNQTLSVAITGSTTNGMTIGNFTTNQADLNSVPLGAGGSAILTVGADLTVDAATASVGTFQPLNYTIAVTYN